MESEKASSQQELNLGDLCLWLPVLSHCSTTARQPPTLKILHMHCTGGIECLSCTPGSHSMCSVRTPLGTLLRVNQKILSIRILAERSGVASRGMHAMGRASLPVRLWLGLGVRARAREYTPFFFYWLTGYKIW